MNNDKARELVAQAMMRCGLATGHGDTLEDLLAEMEAQVNQLQERVNDAESRAEEWTGGV